MRLYEDKRGFGLFFVFALIIAFLVIAIVASVLGLRAISESLDKTGTENIIIALAFALAFIFRDFVKTVLVTIWGWFTAIVHSIFRG